MRRLWTALALLLLSNAALADVPASSSRRTSAEIGGQTDPAVASNGTDYLAVWTRKAWLGPPEAQVSAAHVYGTVIRADGSVVGDVATQLDAGTGAQLAYGQSLSAARDGYFAAWLTETGMTAAIVDSQGRVTRTVSVAQSLPGTSGHTLTAWDGSTHLVLHGFDWESSPRGVYSATLIDDNANVVASNIPIGNSDGWQQAVTADSSGFLVLSTRKGWNGNPDVIFGRRVQPNGTVGDWFQIRTTNSPISSIAVVADGARDVIAWSDTNNVWAAEFDPQTNAIGEPHQLASSPCGWFGVRLLRTADALWVGFGQYCGPRTTPGSSAIRLNRDLSPDARSGVSGVYLTLASNGQSVLAITANGQGIQGRFVAPAGDSFEVARSETNQDSGDLASDGSTVVAVWRENLAYANQSIFASVHVPGSETAQPDVQISSSFSNSSPAVAPSSTSWLIAWIRSDGMVVARRFSAKTNRVIDTSDIVIGAARTGSAVRLASDGSGWVVMWTTSRTSCCEYYEYAQPLMARVSSDGIVLDPNGIDINPSVGIDTTGFDVAWDGVRYVAAWTNRWAVGPTFWVTGAAISSDLKQIEYIPLTAFDTAVISTPRVAAIQNSAVLAWDRAGSTQYAVFNEPSIPRLPRTRAVGAPRAHRTLEGSLLGVSPSATGELMIYTIRKIPGTSQNGIFFSIPAADGTVIGSGMTTVLEGDEYFTGRIARSGKYAWMARTAFDAPGGANRVFMKVVDAPR